VGCCIVALASAHAAAASPMVMPPHYSLVHHPVSTTSASAQTSFDEGLTLLYSFNRLAARNAFMRAANADPSLAMAYWGIAESYGPNVNVPIDETGERAASDALAHAKSLLGNASEEEAAYIAALSVRYSTAPRPNYNALARAYERAMSDLSHKYPDDLDAATLFAESEMDLHAWAWFSTSGQPVEGTNEIIATLESVLARDPMHIGANHYYIHATEESKAPERALLSAQRLGTFTFEPAAAHLVHMPAHTFLRTGFYDQASAVNMHATEHDRMYLASAMDPEASGYYDHNLYFLASADQMEGNFAGARAAGLQADGKDAGTITLYALCRFSRWHDILSLPAPKGSPPSYDPLRPAIWHFARGMAYAGTGDGSAAQKELQMLGDLNRSMSIPAVTGWTNSSKQILGIAIDVLGAKIDRAGNRYTDAASLLVRAVRLQDGLNYIEPPDWYYPVRESLGAALLKAGDAKGAERTFREDLVRNPRNPRSLFGLQKALEAEGDATDAAWVQRAFAMAWRNADTQLSIDDL
jgi:tetratricopeptide (TPR) repeat protein